MSDLVLPEMSERALAEQIVAIRPDVRVVYLSGSADGAFVHNGELDTNTPFLQEPFTLEGPARKVREVLNQPGQTSSSRAESTTTEAREGSRHVSGSKTATGSSRRPKHLAEATYALHVIEFARSGR
jgi:DNA-binding NtrC family response regulator